MLINSSYTDGKRKSYEEVIEQVKLIMEVESNIIAKMANATAILKDKFEWAWIGFYLLDEGQKNQLVLGPFQGQLATFRVYYNQGTIGKCWNMGKPLVIANMDDFEEHTAHIEGAISEIVVPLLDNNHRFIGALDVISKSNEGFCEIDKIFLEKIVRFVT